MELYFSNGEILFDDTIDYENICIYSYSPMNESTFLIKLHVSFSFWRILYYYTYVTLRSNIRKVGNSLPKDDAIQESLYYYLNFRSIM